MLKDERGAIAVLSAFALLIIMAAGASVVDLGMQRVARGDAQGVADVVALDLVRDLDGRTVGQLQSVVNADAASSIARNTSTLGARPTATVLLGMLGSNGGFVELSGTSIPTAIKVRIATSVGFAFAGITGRSSGAAARSSVAATSSNACFRLGSFAASLRSGDSKIAGVFENMLGSNSALGFNIGAIGYMGLINSSVGIDALAAQLGFGTPDALIQQGNISVANLFQASAQVLTANGDTSAGAIMGQIAGRVSSTVVANIGNILSVGTGQGAGASINAIDLLGGAALGAALLANIADHNNLLHTGVVWSAPHASNGDIALTVIEAPKQGCGMPGTASATTGQMQLITSIGFNLPNSIAGLNDSNSTDVTTKQAAIAVDAELGGALGTLTGMTCNTTLTETRVRVDTRLTKLSVSLPFQLNGTISSTGIVPAALVPAILKNAASLSVTLHLAMTASSYAQTAANIGTQDTLYDVPPHNYTDPQTSPGSSSSYIGLVTPTVSVDLANSTAVLSAKIAGVTISAAVDINGLDLSSITSAAATSVIGTSTAEVVTNLNDALTPVAQLLGIRFAGADLFGVPTPTCSKPALVG